MGKPVIGIVAKHYRKNQNYLETFIRDEVEQAIFDNGGIAIGILPPNEDKIVAKDNWQEQLTTTEKHNFYEQIALCDGIILQGGGFVDEYECFIAKYCYDYDIPILGICAGKHILVRAVGGSIGKLENDNHNREDKYVHSIKIDKNSKAYELIGKEVVEVNSRHIRYSLNTGKAKIVAVSSDGVDEIIEDASKRFYIGVQFHPESLYKKDEYMNHIFLSFIETCFQYKKEKIQFF